MTTTALIITTTLALLALAHARLAAGFINLLKRPQPPPLANDECPKTALIICIRGHDSALEHCLQAALDQDYPDYTTHIVVDSETDPAWPIIQKVRGENHKAASTVQVLENPKRTCSLKCSSLIQAITALDDSYEVIALLDTDVVPHRQWLRSVLAPMRDKSIGAATGHRWFVPETRTLVNLSRHAWNAAAVVLMTKLEIASGCSLAIRREVFDKGQLLHYWASAYGEDTSVKPALDSLGLELAFAPAAMLPERQGGRLTQFQRWITRQLISCRLQHEAWPWVAAHGWITSLTLAAAAVLAVFGLATTHLHAAAIAALSLVGFVLVLTGLLTWLDGHVSRMINGIDRRPGPSPAQFAGILLAQLAYGRGLLSASFARNIEWRGIRYRIHDRRLIDRVDYHPADTGPELPHSGRHAGATP